MSKFRLWLLRIVAGKWPVIINTQMRILSGNLDIQFSPGVFFLNGSDTNYISIDSKGPAPKA